MPRPAAERIAVSRSERAMAPPPSPVVSTIVESWFARVAPATLCQPSPIDWKAVPTIAIRSGALGSQNMFAQAMKCPPRSEEHTSELQSRGHLVCRLLLEKKKSNHALSWE